MPCFSFFSRHNRHIELFQEYCRQGRLRDAQKISYTFTREDIRADDNYAFRLAFGNEHVEVVKWLSQYLTADDIKKDDNYLFQLACKHGYFEIARWLVNQFGLGADDIQARDNWALKVARANGHTHLARWISNVLISHSMYY